MSAQKPRLYLTPFWTKSASSSPVGPTSKTFAVSYDPVAWATGVYTEVIDVRGAKKINFHVHVTAGTTGILKFKILGNSHAEWTRTGDLRPITKTDSNGTVTQEEISVDLAAITDNPSTSGVLSFEIAVDCEALGVLCLVGKSSTGGITCHIDADVEFAENQQPLSTNPDDPLMAMRLGALSIL